MIMEQTSQDSFEQTYRCYPLSDMAKFHLETGDKIIMPVSALERLILIPIDYPILFETQNPSTGRVSHCGVLEFSGTEGSVFLPNWMMKNMQLHEGEDVIVKNAKLPKGTYMKLQAHTTEFIRISDPKVVLESTLRNFSCLSMGDTIMITHNGKEFYIDVVETKPCCATSIIETDCEVDFDPPLDYKEAEKPKPALEDAAMKVEKEPKFKAFMGVVRRLDGKPVVMKEEQSQKKRPGKFGVGYDVIQPKKKQSTRLSKADVQAETLKEEGKFQPFTGKYTLTASNTICTN